MVDGNYLEIYLAGAFALFLAFQVIVYAIIDTIIRTIKDYQQKQLTEE